MLTEGFFAVGFAGAFFALAFAAVGFVVAFAMGISCLVYVKVRDYLFLKQGLKYKFCATVAKRELGWSLSPCGVFSWGASDLNNIYSRLVRRPINFATSILTSGVFTSQPCCKN